MDAFIERIDALEACVAKQLRPMLNQQVSVVFYELTTVRIHGDGDVPGEVRAYGMNKGTGGIARQFVLGVSRAPRGCR